MSVSNVIYDLARAEQRETEAVERVKEAHDERVKALADVIAILKTLPPGKALSCGGFAYWLDERSGALVHRELVCSYDYVVPEPEALDDTVDPSYSVKAENGVHHPAEC